MVPHLLVCLLKLGELLLELNVAQNCVVVVGWVVDDPAESELSVRRDGKKKQRRYQKDGGRLLCEVFHWDSFLMLGLFRSTGIGMGILLACGRRAS